MPMIEVRRLILFFSRCYSALDTGDEMSAVEEPYLYEDTQ